MEGDPRLEADVVNALEYAASLGALTVSAVSLWEVATLEAAGRVRFLVPVSAWLEEALATPGLSVLNVDPHIAAESASLPDAFSGDAVDRILVASARVRHGRLYTADPVIAAYAERGYVDVRTVGASA